jgi:hypothetical protein
MDPRDIILEKYDDLEGQVTNPSDETNPETYIPETGRTDPLTIVNSAIPEELRPPRTGDTDLNEIDTYFVAQQATAFVNAIRYSIQCHNVIQIGIEKYATFSTAQGRFLLSEGQSTSFGLGYVNGILLVGTVTCASVDTDRVVLRVTVYGEGTTTSISKDQTYIPRGFD